MEESGAGQVREASGPRGERLEVCALNPPTLFPESIKSRSPPFEAFANSVASLSPFMLFGNLDI